MSRATTWFASPATLIGVLALAACRGGGTEGAAAEGGVRAKNDEFCRLLEAQFAAMTKAQADLADPAKRRAYFTAQKEMNAKILKAAPAEVQGAAELQVRTSNAVYDSQLAGDRDRSATASAVLSAKENMDASKRMTDYCRIETPTPR